LHRDIDFRAQTVDHTVMSYENYSHIAREHTHYCAKCGHWLNSDDPNNPFHFACPTALYPAGRKYRLFEPETYTRIDFPALNMDHAVLQAEKWLARRFGTRQTVAYVTELRDGMPYGRPAVAYTPIPAAVR
jgi:hypothetical protein